MVASEQGHYVEALEHIRRAIDIDERTLGRDHPDVAVRLNSLGLVLDAQGAHTAAIPFFRRAVEIDEKALGPDHPVAEKIRQNLALSLSAASGRLGQLSDGPVVCQVTPGSPAEALGMALGDWIVEYGGQ